jgi:hypothetical protein
MFTGGIILAAIVRHRFRESEGGRNRRHVITSDKFTEAGAALVRREFGLLHNALSVRGHIVVYDA